MCVPAWCLLLLLLLCPGSLEMVVFDKTRQSDRWHMYEIDKGEDIKNYKRHSDGTFTSDLSRYLDRIKAKDFVQWLANKREGCLEDHPFFEGD